MRKLSVALGVHCCAAMSMVATVFLWWAFGVILWEDCHYTAQAQTVFFPTPQCSSMGCGQPRITVTYGTVPSCHPAYQRRPGTYLDVPGLGSFSVRDARSAQILEANLRKHGMVPDPRSSSERFQIKR